MRRAGSSGPFRRRVATVMLLLAAASLCGPGAARPAARAAEPQPAGQPAEADADLTRVANLGGLQAAEIVRRQQEKPRVPVARTAAEIEPVLQRGPFDNDGERVNARQHIQYMLRNLPPNEPNPLLRFLVETQSRNSQQWANTFADCLHLPAVTRLSDEAAASLALFEGTLTLQNLKELRSASLAEKLARQSVVRLNSVRVLSREAADALAAHPGNLHLHFLTTLDSPALARKIGSLQAVTLPVERLDPEIARMLATGRARLDFTRLTALSAEAADALADCEGEIHLSALQALDSARLARKLARQQTVTLGVKTLSPEIAKIVGECRGCINLLRVESLAPEAAAALAKCPGVLAPVLRTLDSPDLARRLGERPAVNLQVEYLTPEVAAALVEHRTGILQFDRLQEADPETLRALSNAKGPIMLPGIKTLSPDMAAALARGHWETLHLNGLADPPPEIVRILARCPGQIVLPGIRSVSPEMLAALGDARGRIQLPGLRDLAPEAAEALAVSEHTMIAPHLISRLTVPIAEALAKQAGPLHLPRVTAFDSPDSVAIASILATKQGRIVLPALKSISPQTLTVLAAKPDIDLPLLETLDLIAEPDGGPTDDFVVPADFAERQAAKRATGSQRVDRRGGDRR